MADSKDNPGTLGNASEPIFTVTLDKGMADRNRLPLADVIRFLTELKSLVIETGKEIERERGVSAPAGDYGLEILADGSGRFLVKGSVRANIAITRNIDVGALAVSRVLQTLQSLNSKRKGPKRVDKLDAVVVHRLDKLAFINTTSKVDAKFKLIDPRSFQVDGKRHISNAAFNEQTIKTIREYNPSPVFI
jgi:hypothetical protein